MKEKSLIYSCLHRIAAISFNEKRVYKNQGEPEAVFFQNSNYTVDDISTSDYPECFGYRKM
jgi:hypothetical protein